MVSLNEEARSVVLGVGECAAGMAEELTLEQRRRHRGAVDGDERAVLSSAGRVDAAGDELLSRPRLAVHEDARITSGDPGDRLVHATHRAAGANDVRWRLRRFDLVA